MRTLFAVPWFSTSGKRLLISLATALLLVSGVFALLKTGGGGKRASPELVTGSIQRSQVVRRTASSDPLAAFLVAPPSVAPSTQGTVQRHCQFHCQDRDGIGSSSNSTNAVGHIQPLPLSRQVQAVPLQIRALQLAFGQRLRRVVLPP